MANENSTGSTSQQTQQNMSFRQLPPITIPRAVSYLRQTADEALRSTGGVHHMSRQYKEGVGVLHAISHALQQLGRAA